MKKPEFLYFDLGNVLLLFDHSIACRGIAKLTGVSEDEVRRIIFDEGLEHRYERGDVTSEEFYEHLCAATGCRPDAEAVYRAASDIFTVHEPVRPIVEHLHARGWPLGILSNTCECHWQFCLDRWPFLREQFGVHALSFELNRMKPEPEIYERAARLAGVPPEAIFFTDDRPENVEGAREAGFDAVLFESPQSLYRELVERGVLDAP